MRFILWLDEIESRDKSRVGAKAFNLAEIRRAGFVVPASFCITAAAYQDFVTLNGLDSAINELLHTPQQDVPGAASALQEAFRRGQISAQVRGPIVSAYRQLRASCAPGVQGVAVRSSASAEDWPTASFAGQQATLLNVTYEEQLLRAVLECWASLWSPQAVAYRLHQGLREAPTMAVLVQCMVNAESAGVVFSQDPLSGEEKVIIEAMFGLGEAIVSGATEFDRYTVDRTTCLESEPPLIGHKRQQHLMSPGGGVQIADIPAKLERARVLTEEQVRQVAATALALEHHFGCPQDLEWAFAEERLHLLQARPITTATRSFFTDVIPSDDYIWTSGFLNERFPLPVSPLGWTLIQGLLERLAFRDPLRYLGLRGVENLSITKLYRGHPYVNLFVFQTLYRVFPDWLLPEDAWRYFPSGRTELRRAVRYPLFLFDPRFLLSMARHFWESPRAWSPWHNHRAWADFVRRHDRRSEELDASYRALLAESGDIQQIWEIVEAAQELNTELLALHRWGLTCADLTYSLLRRLVRSFTERADAMTLCTQLVTGLPNKSVEMNDSLYDLAQHMDDSAAISTKLAAFVAQFGHRSFYLDIYHPTFGEQPAQVLDLVQCLRSQAGQPRPDHAAKREEARRVLRAEAGRGPLGRMKRGIFDHVLYLTQCYVPLREDQRFYWQRTLAMQRKLFLLLGKRMTDLRVLQQEGQVFFLTLAEIETYVRGQTRGEQYAELAKSRQQQFERLCRESEAAPDHAYPPFLRGNRPWPLEPHERENLLQGRGVSPGLGRGRAVILRSPAELNRVKRGDVLVTQTLDPGWTPVFALLNALVLEHGGQLSHAAVVAREYGLPAVTGIPHVTELLHDGEMLLVDGTAGYVSRIPSQALRTNGHAGPSEETGAR